MPQREHAHLFRDMSRQAFHLYTKDMDTLRNRYTRASVDIGRTLINRLKRTQLVNAILADQFGADAVMDYISQCREWDEMKDFVENKT